MIEAEMPNHIWEYTPTGRSWDSRYAEDPPVILNPTTRGKLPVRSLDLGALALLACAMLWFAHQFRTERVHAAAVTASPRFASYSNCKLVLPGVQPEQIDGNPTHTRFHPYNYTVCDGVQVTLWSEMR